MNNLAKILATVTLLGVFSVGAQAQDIIYPETFLGFMAPATVGTGCTYTYMEMTGGSWLCGNTGKYSDYITVSEPVVGRVDFEHVVWLRFLDSKKSFRGDVTITAAPDVVKEIRKKLQAGESVYLSSDASCRTYLGEMPTMVQKFANNLKICEGEVAVR